ncbi:MULTISPECIES: acyl carrier protein [Chryseobacterium]|jgi:acyl carrier protein|uniref:acyl carrier protein n=1 Tax=Chryseobacterium TaxID=59732 RepID=UPI000645F497|nr:MULTISPECIES: acyl carrier protein [Chryseobacterium]MCC3217901.1 acyl carrier protein [Chryseobacterium sp. X308]MDR6463021.1 acyl carrier protein [Chryseobacterium sediminis]MDR6487562.1 acyl carrier protein [Chryseobacterium vietnamense]
MKNKIIEILNSVRPEFDFSQETDFISRGLLDSFDMVSLVTTLDEQFSISIDGTDILPENFETLESIENVLKRNGAV